jgi:hypothetical protein
VEHLLLDARFDMYGTGDSCSRSDISAICKHLKIYVLKRSSQSWILRSRPFSLLAQSLFRLVVNHQVNERHHPSSIFFSLASSGVALTASRRVSS